MIYFETDQPHYLVWPALAVGIDNEFWIGIGWLNFEIGWRNGDGGDAEAMQKEKNNG
jgi:hypothetical protein